MEYIPNAKTITEYARAKQLKTSQRLELFARVCDAVHYGHQKGIVHRDLKPSNILVDPQGNPRIIDFGVARTTDSDVALATFQTAVGQLIGSLQYMSPEQFDADPHDIDTRSDVYALGLVLYELLTGRLPYDLSRTAIHEAARVVREEEPPRIGRQDPGLRGEIEILVHKALEKDRDRRYQSAFGLAEDIRRYLAGESITARPPSVSYQFQVFARKNKGLLVSVAGVFAVLVAGVVTSTWLYLHAEAQRERAELQTVKAEAATDFLRSMFGATLPNGFGEQLTVEELLDLSRERVTSAFPDEPEVEAEICRTLGWGYLNLDRWEDSEEHLKRALALRSQTLGRDHPATLESLHDLGTFYAVSGRWQDLVDTRTWIRDSRARVLGENDELTLEAEYAVAAALWGLGRLDEAEDSITRTIRSLERAMGKTHPLTLDSRVLLAGIQLFRGKVKEAETLGRNALETCKGTLGNDHPVTRSGRSQLAMTLLIQGKTEDAASLYRRHVPEQFGIEYRFQGDLDPESQGTHVLIFWETWCPFSQRAVPKLEEFYQRYRDQGLDVVGLTRVNRSSTPQRVRDFIVEKGISFPILKTDDRAWKYFDVGGTPWVTVVRDGDVVWENYVQTPEEIPAQVFEGLVGSSHGE